MADTVISSTPVREIREVDSGAGAAGWAVAVVLLLGVILFGIFVWPGLASIAPAAPAPTTENAGIDLNVTIPESVMPGANNSGTNNSTGGSGTQNGGTNSGTQTQ
jgi:hypothetical protein